MHLDLDEYFALPLHATSIGAFLDAEAPLAQKCASAQFFTVPNWLDCSLQSAAGRYDLDSLHRCGWRRGEPVLEARQKMIAATASGVEALNIHRAFSERADEVMCVVPVDHGHVDHVYNMLSDNAPTHMSMALSKVFAAG